MLPMKFRLGLESCEAVLPCVTRRQEPDRLKIGSRLRDRSVGFAANGASFTTDASAISQRLLHVAGLAEATAAAPDAVACSTYHRVVTARMPPR